MTRYRLQFNSLPLHAAILLAVSLPYCINLGRSSIWDANEAFYAETPREMLITGDYLAPQFNFQPRTQKPPFTYWTILASYRLFGVNEFAVRVPGALAAIGVLLFCYGTARMLFGPRPALISAVAAAATARVFILARRLPIDILLLLFLTGTLFFMVRAIQKNHVSSWAMAYLCASLGFLTKGPVAVMIPAASCFVWMLWARRLKTVNPHPFVGAVIFALVALPWYVLVYRAHGWTYISPFFLRDNLGRFATEHLGPPRGYFYYFSVFVTDFFPWSLLALVAAYQLWAARKEGQPLRSLSYGLPMIWCLFTFILFSLSKNKQEYYIAPLYPAAAVIIAGVLDKSMGKGVSGNQREIAAEPQTKGLSAWIWCYGLLALLLFSLSMIMPYVLSSFMPDVPTVLHYAPSLVLFGGSILLVWNIIRGRFVQCFPALAIPLWAVFMMGALFYVPALESFRPVKDFCRTIEAHWRADDEAGYFRTALPSMVYYLRRPIFQESDYGQMLQRFQSGKRVFCILTAKDYASFADKGLTIHVLNRHSRFAARLSTLLNTDDLADEELLLVSNRSNHETKSGEGRPRL